MCRVIGHDRPSGGARRSHGHTIWLNYQGQQILASPEQLRWAMPEEIMAWNTPGDVATEIGADRHSRVTYADVRWKPPAAEPEERAEHREEDEGLWCLLFWRRRVRDPPNWRRALLR